MRNLLAGSIFLALIITSGPNAVAEPILVLVHNYAGVEATVLKRAERSAARVLGTGGVQVKWFDCSEAAEALQQCQDPPRSSALVLHLLPSGATRRAAPAGSLGFAVPPEPGQFGSFAGVFYDRVERLSSRGFNEPMILGHAMAHEIGHLLLGVEGHSDDGIMKAEWHRKELKQATNEALIFDAVQRNSITQTLKARLLAAHITSRTHRPKGGQEHRADRCDAP
jgi:hypothetical protein